MPSIFKAWTMKHTDELKVSLAISFLDAHLIGSIRYLHMSMQFRVQATSCELDGHLKQV